MAKYTQNAVWADTLRLTRTHWGALIAIAGVFVFLPTLLVNHFYPLGDPPQGPDVRAVLRFYMEYFQQHSLVLVLQSFVTMTGGAAMLRLVFAQGGTVGGAIAFAIALLPTYSILMFLVGLGVGAGAALFLVPGLYLWGRLLTAAPAMVAEQRRNPIDALKRGFALSEGHGWLNLGLYLLVAIPGMVLAFALSKLGGILFILVAGQQTGTLLAEILLCAVQAVVVALLTMLTAALYRALAPQKPEVQDRPQPRRSDGSR